MIKYCGQQMKDHEPGKVLFFLKNIFFFFIIIILYDFNGTKIDRKITLTSSKIYFSLFQYYYPYFTYFLYLLQFDLHQQGKIAVKSLTQ